jgi:urease subunit beta
MIPGEILLGNGDIELNAGQPTVTVDVANASDRPIEIGSHYHFYEANPALRFDREATRGMRLDIASGDSVRFAPGETRTVTLVPFRGARIVFGFNRKVMGKLDR